MKGLVVKFNDVEDLRTLEDGLMQTPLQAKRGILAVAHQTGLVKLPWYLRPLTNLFTKGIMNDKYDPKHVNVMWELLVEHVVRGKDTTGENKVGGFTEAEFEIFIDILKTFGWENG